MANMDDKDSLRMDLLQYVIYIFYALGVGALLLGQIGVTIWMFGFAVLLHLWNRNQM